MVRGHDLNVNDYVVVNRNLTLNDEIVIPRGTRVKIADVVPRPISSSCNQMWGRNAEDTMYFIVYPATIITAIDFPRILDINQPPPDCKVATTKFTFAEPRHPKTRYRRGEKVVTTAETRLQGVIIPAGTPARVLTEGSGRTQPHPVSGGPAWHILMFTQEKHTGVAEHPYPFALVREELERTRDQTPLIAPVTEYRWV